jgi:hypothetical protein
MIGIKSCVKNLINDIYSHSRKFDMVAKIIQEKVQFQQFCQLIVQPFQIVFFYQKRICWKISFFIRLFFLLKYFPYLHEMLAILKK